MSFTLELLHAPRPLALAEAVALSDRPAPLDEASRQRFRRFAAGVLRAYPDGCEADVDGDDPGNAWAEAPDPESADAAVWVIAPKTGAVDEQFMAHVALAAAAADLHVLDPQNALLYRPDRTLVGADGRARRLATPATRVPIDAAAPAARRGADEASPQFTEREVAAFLHSRLARRFAARGFGLVDNPRWVPYAARQRGLVRQVVAFGPIKRDGEMWVSVSFSLACEPVSQVWQRLIVQEVSAYVALVHQRDLPCHDTHLHAEDLGASAEDAARGIGRFQHGRASDLAGVHRWADGVEAWLESGGMAALDAIDRPAGLAAAVLTAPMHDRVTRNELLSPWQQFSLLVLAGAFGDAADEQWNEAIFSHWNRHHRYTSDWKSVLPDLRATLERLVAKLRTPEFTAEAGALRAAA